MPSILCRCASSMSQAFYIDYFKNTMVFLDSCRLFRLSPVAAHLFSTARGANLVRPEQRPGEKTALSPLSTSRTAFAQWLLQQGPCLSGFVNRDIYNTCMRACQSMGVLHNGREKKGRKKQSNKPTKGVTGLVCPSWPNPI